MIDLIKTATELSAQGVIISVDVKMWNGKLPRRHEWGMLEVKLLPNQVVTAFSDVKNRITGNILQYSVPCYDGNFVPNRVLPELMLKHDKHCETFYKARSEIISHYDGFRDAARSAAYIKYVEVWRKNHPLEVMPPPSGGNYAANLAMSLVPTKENFYDLYKVERHVSPHSFCFMGSDSRCSFLENSEKKDMAWQVLDELLASNVRRLIACLMLTKKTRLFGAKVRQVLDSCKLFVNTDMLPLNSLRSKVQELIEIADYKTTVQIDRKEFHRAIEDVINLAKKLSTVSDISEILA
jgi:hypothetical protein